MNIVSCIRVIGLTMVGCVLTLILSGQGQERVSGSGSDLIAPAKSTETGLLLEPPLELSWFTKDKFIELISTVGTEKIGKQWSSPVAKIELRDKVNINGLTLDEVKAYMVEAKQRFDRGESTPVSDVGLISTQEDVVRQPMLNHIAAFANSDVRVYLLVQALADNPSWGYFSIVQDMTLDPTVSYFAELKPAGVKFEGISCFKCHSSGPLAIHPAREDLVLDARLAAELSQYIATQPRSEFYFPEHEQQPDYGKPLSIGFCTDCHSEDGERNALFDVHSHPIRILVDFGYMPPDQTLTPEEIAELKAWLDRKD